MMRGVEKSEVGGTLAPVHIHCQMGKTEFISWRGRMTKNIIVRSGQLTRGEVRKIREEQRELRQERRDYLSDGRLSRSERRDLRNDQRKLNRLIQRSKYDRDRRYRR
jgi:Spy/CpxP family protein refolding chaperone